MTKSIFSDEMLARLRTVRSGEVDGERCFSVVDFIAIWTGTNNPRVYWAQIKRRFEQISVVYICKQLKLKSGDGKTYRTDVATVDELMDIVLAIPALQANMFHSLTRGDWYFALTGEMLEKWHLSSLMSSESDEWYTPQHIVDLVHSFLGEVDLDPCSCAAANEIIRAKLFYTRGEDGLTQDWTTARAIYMNPPYGRDIHKWVTRLHEVVTANKEIRAITLLPLRADTKWFRQLRDFPQCHVKGRLKFWGGSQSHPATFPSVIIGMNVDLALFSSTFEPVGDIYVRTDNERSA